VRFLFLITGLGVGGIVAVIIALHTGAGAWRLAREGSRTTALIVEMVRDHEEGGSAAPKFRFKDGEGAEHTVASNFYRHPPAYHVGDTVKVIYEKANPEHASIDSFGHLWMVPLCAAAAGGLFLLASGVLGVRCALRGSR
jgi:hypothetical protein